MPRRRGPTRSLLRWRGRPVHVIAARIVAPLPLEWPHRTIAKWSFTRRRAHADSPEVMSPLGRSFFGGAVAGSGLIQLVTGDFVRLVARSPSGSILPIAVGAVLVAAGCAIAAGRATRPAAGVVAILLVLSLLLAQGPRLVENPGAFFMWINPLKAVALLGGAVLLVSVRGAASLRLAILALGVFLVVCGIAHFVYLDFTAELVPAWIPGRRFWAVATGLALIAGGAGLLIPPTAWLAATLSAAMILLWVLMLHIPRALAGPDQAGEAAGVFEALALSGVSIMVAAALGGRAGATMRGHDRERAQG